MFSASDSLSLISIARYIDVPALQTDLTV